MTIELYINLDYALSCLLIMLFMDYAFFHSCLLWLILILQFFLEGWSWKMSVVSWTAFILNNFVLKKNIHDKIILNALTMSLKHTQEQFLRLSKFNQSWHHAPFQLGLGDKPRTSSLTLCKVTVKTVKCFHWFLFKL